MPKSSKLRRNPLKGVSLFTFIMVFGVVGTALLLISKAAGTFESVEPETSPLVGNAIRLDDTDASGGQYVQFGTTPPSASVSGKDYYGISPGGSFIHLDDSQVSQQLDGYVTLGAKWVRFEVSWADVQAGGSTSYTWTRYDTLMKELNKRGLKGLAILDWTPNWAKASGCTQDWCPPANNADFANFASAVVTRYAPQGLRYWEIWNEPNIDIFWKPQPNAAAYMNMVKAVYPAIKAADPGAIVISGGLAPAVSDGSSITPVDYLTAMYSNGLKNNSDAIGFHPYCYFNTFDCPTTYVDWSSWSRIKDTPSNLRAVMAANGDSAKKIWATEFGAPTNGGSDAVTEAHQATMVTDAYNLWKTYDFAGPLFWYNYTDTCANTNDKECWFGLTRANGTLKQSATSYLNSVNATP